MKIFIQRVFLLSILSCFSLVPAFAQRTGGIAVQGKINVQQGSVEGAIIQMYRDGKRLDNYGVGSDGNYKVELPYNHKYELVFYRQDNFPQKIAVDANVPANILKNDPVFPPFPLDINLFTEIPGIDKTFSENTTLKIYYNPDVDNFVSEIYYNDAQIAKLIEQAKLQSQMIGKEADYLSKLTRAELAELRKEYNELLEEASKEYSEEKFLAALDGFKAASKIFPNEQFPKDRIAEINDLLGLMMVSAELDKALNERFTALIKEADLHFNQQKYNEARNAYNRALSIKPTDNYANGQIKKINDILKRQQQDQQYQDLITQADVSFKQLLYNDARTKYEEALGLRPNESYPKSKMAEIDGLLAKQAKDLEKQESYKQAMFQAETMFEKQFYDKAIASYENALNFRPEDPVATRKIAEVKAIMKEISDKMLFEELVKNADKAYKKEDFQTALTTYSQAADLFPNDAHVNERINEINGVLQLKENFADLVFKADNQFNAANYEASKDLYQKALAIHADDKHALERVTEINGILASQNLDNQYNAIIAEADQLFSDKNWEQAKAKYNNALTLKSKEKYPKDRISEIDGTLQAIAKTNQDYQQVIARADGFFNQKDFTRAKAEFENAGKIKPEESYPSEMIVKIDNLVEEQNRLAAEAEAEKARLAAAAAAAEAARLAAIQAEKDKNYADAIARGDNLFNGKEYENARNEYRTALTVKPEETYPQQRIDEIGTLLVQLSAAQKAYEDAVKIADREFKAEKFDAAITAYNTAKTAKPEETYPDEMLAIIDSIVTTRARLAEEAAAAEAARLAAIQAEKDKNYADAIARGDNLFNGKEYENARNEYRTALTVKPEEAYPQQRIDEIGTLLAQLSAAQKAYEDAVKIADREFKAEKFDAATTAYNTAKTAKPEETYPDEMLAKIDSIVTTRARLAEEAAVAEAARLAAIQAEKDKNYGDAIARGDNLFNQKEYENARNEYRTALTVKPEETYPQQRIDEIGKMLAEIELAKKEQELLDKNYNNLILQADRFFTAKNYDQSKGKFNDALALKPEESYPKERVKEIEKILAQQAVDEQYRTIVLVADGFFKTEKYLQAKEEYGKAVELKPEEQYPKNQIIKIDDILAKEQQRILAEKAAAEDLQRRSEEISRMNQEIEARGVESEAELNSLYNDYIKQADALFDGKQYNVSRGWYYKAWDVKPAEKYPPQRIAEINRIVGGLLSSQTDRDYQKFIDLADSTFRENQFAVARGWYNRALSVKANENYPKNQLTEIEKKIAERMAGQSGQQFDNDVQKGEKAFAEANYNVARFWYKKALELRPNDEDVKKRLDEIQEALK